MKFAVFILIGYISCTLKCEVNKINTGNKTEGVQKGNTSDNAAESPRDYNQTEYETRDASESPRDSNKKDVVKRDGRETPSGIIKTKNVVKIGTIEPSRVSNKKENVVTTRAAEPTNDLNQTGDVVTINAAESPREDVVLNQTKYVVTKEAVKSPDDTRKHEEYVQTTLLPGMISKSYVMASKALIQQLDWSNSTPSVQPHYEDPPDDTYQSESTDFPDVIESYVIASRALIHKLEWLNSTLPVSTAQPKYDDTTEMYEKISRNYINTTKETHELDRLSSSLSDHTEQSEYEDTTEMLEKISRNYIKTAKQRETHKLDEVSSNKTKTTMKLKLKASDNGPGIIKVEDALKILELSKSKYALASVALIQRLEWLRSTYNVTELMLDHKVDVNQFSYAQNSSNVARILRTNVEDEFMYLKNAILDVSSKLGKMIVTDN